MDSSEEEELALLGIILLDDDHKKKRKKKIRHLFGSVRFLSNVSSKNGWEWVLKRSSTV